MFQEVLVKLCNPTRQKGSFSTTMGLQMGEVGVTSIVTYIIIYVIMCIVMLSPSKP